MNNDMKELIVNGMDREPEVPEFIIEHDDEDLETPKTPEEKPSFFRRHKWLRRLLKAFAVVLLAALTLGAYKAWNYYYNIGVPISTTPKQNIRKLQTPPEKKPANVVHKTDSIFGF